MVFPTFTYILLNYNTFLKKFFNFINIIFFLRNFFKREQNFLLVLMSIFLSPWKIDFVILRSRGASLMYALQCNMSSDRGMTIIIIKSVYNLCSKHERSNRSRLLCRWTDIICQLCRKRVTIMVNRLMFFSLPSFRNIKSKIRFTEKWRMI